MIILPAIDIKDGNCVRLVKGDYGTAHKVAESYMDTARSFEQAGSQWIHMVDLDGAKDASTANKEIFLDVAKNTRLKVEVGGGISSVDDFRELLRSGADKVSVNSAAVRNPQLIHDAAEIFGSQCVVVAIDAKKKGDSWTVVVNGGRIDMNIDAIEWAKKAEELGAGEILLTSMDTDGMKTGFDIELLNAVCDVVKIPVIASGGCGTLEHFSEVFQKTKASAALAASLFHYKELTVSQVKEHLEESNIPVRCVD